MKTKAIALLVLLSISRTEQSNSPKPKRDSLGTYTLGESLGSYPAPTSGWKGLNNPVQLSWTPNSLPLHAVDAVDYNLQVDLPAPRRLPPPRLAYINSNSIEKPVMEPQEYVPPQSVGSATIPAMPPPATPVNALASNVPGNGGAIFLGAGSLGVVRLGNGAYALGAGSIGYSENRSRPRPNDRVPVYPPIQASPNLIPAAVPSPAPYQPGLLPGQFDFGGYKPPQVPLVDQNGYEYLAPDRVGFGDPLPPRPVRTRQQFATPTAPGGPQVLQYSDIYGQL